MPQGIRENETQFNFRIDRKLLEAFKAKAKLNNSNASQELLAFIEEYVSSGHTEPARGYQQPVATDGKIEAMAEAIATLQKQMSEILEDSSQKKPTAA